MPTVDADCHVIETERTWEFMDEGDARYRPVRIRTEREMGRLLRDNCWAIDGRLIARGVVGVDTTSEESRELKSIEARLQHMDQLGVDVQVLYPSLFLRPFTNDPKVELALCKSYNRWLADIWGKAEDRLRWAAILPWLSLPEAIGEMEIAKQQGACAVFMRGFEADRHLGDSYFFPAYEAAEGLNLPICAHAGNSSFVIEQFYSRASGLNFFRFPVIDGLMSLYRAKVPEQFPTLRFGFIEVAAQWVPYAVHDMVGRAKVDLYSIMHDSRFYVACQTTDDIPYILKYSSEDNLVIGSDYGHADQSSEIEALRRLREMEEIEDTVVGKILEANPTALYGL